MSFVGRALVARLTVLAEARGRGSHKAGDKPPPYVVVIALILTIACTQPAPSPEPAAEPKRGGVLTLLMSQTGDPSSFDLHQESVAASIEAAGGAYDNLIMFDPMDPNRIVPDLAESWEAATDGMSYTFRLHKGVRFQNGNALT